MAEGLRLAVGSGEHSLLPKMANRNGLIDGATGTVETHFEGRFTRFENLAHRSDGPPRGHD